MGTEKSGRPSGLTAVAHFNVDCYLLIVVFFIIYISLLRTIRVFFLLLFTIPHKATCEIMEGMDFFGQYAKLMLGWM
jgi:hypothetical protein